jgi:enamine deaminase RidA (YjgF/YER057c/UK114 family)
MPRIERFNPPGLSDPRNRYSHVVKAGNLVFIAGQTGTDANGNVVGDDMTSQAKRAYGNLKTAIESVGGKVANIVKTTTYIIDRESAKFSGPVRKELFGEILPTSALVIVAGLGRPELLIEVEAIAVLED